MFLLRVWRLLVIAKFSDKKIKMGLAKINLPYFHYWFCSFLVFSIHHLEFLLFMLQNSILIYDYFDHIQRNFEGYRTQCLHLRQLLNWSYFDSNSSCSLKQPKVLFAWFHSNYSLRCLGLHLRAGSSDQDNLLNFCSPDFHIH